MITARLDGPPITLALTSWSNVLRVTEYQLRKLYRKGLRDQELIDRALDTVGMSRQKIATLNTQLQYFLYSMKPTGGALHD